MSDKVKVCGLEWEDTTSYSRGDTNRKPTCWTAKVGVFRVTVVSDHIYHFGEWVAHCSPFFDTRPLNAGDRDDAMAKALALLRVPIVQAYQVLIKLPKKTGKESK